MTSRTSLIWALVAALSSAGLYACGSDSTPSGSTPSSGGATSGGAGGSGGVAGSGGVVVPEGTPPLLAQDCDPLVPAICALPFPSDVYLQDDPTGRNPSGKAIRVGATTLPIFGMDGNPFDPTLLHDIDGWGPGMAATTYFENASHDGLADPETIAGSVEDASRTFIIEAETGRRIPHWVDIDESTRFNGLNGFDDQRAFMLRPAEHLKHGTRYIVAIRGVHDRDGQEIAPSEAFLSLRDGTDTSEPSVILRRDLYADIFGRLDGAGIPKDALQIAWDYTTTTRESQTGRMVSVRDQALEAVGADGPTYVIKTVEENPNPHILRRIIVTMTLPNYLTSAAAYDPADPENTAGRLNLDDQGMPVQNGTMEWDMIIHVPKSIEGGTPHGILQNGHGLFGSGTEAQNGHLARTANNYGWIAISMNFFGFANAEIDLATEALVGKEHLLRSFVDRQHQGHVNQLLGMRMMIGRVARDGIFDENNTELLPASAIDASVRAYRGDSQGGIMGSVYMALSTDVTRGLLGEPGLPYTLLLNRSLDWPGYGFVLDTATENDLEVQVMMGLIQTVWGQTAPSGYAYSLTGNDRLPNTPDHRVILHDAIGDHQVTTYGAHILARAIGAGQLKANDGKVIRELYGIENVDGPLTEGSALIEHDFNLAPEPLGNTPPSDGCDPHDRVRGLQTSSDQQHEFFTTGSINWKCDGVCNCDGPREEVGCELTRCN